MKLILLTLSIAFSTQFIFGQNDALRYRIKRFNQIDSQTDVTYGRAPQWVWPYWNVDLKMNVYQPNGDTLSRRPLIIFAHAGGFINGSKEVDDMVALCDSFAKKGYVTATIDYRKGFNPLDGSSAERAVYRGVQDGKAAVRYFKENAAIYRVDTNFIYFGGMSAGGYIALHVAYMNQESDRPNSTYGGGTVNDLGCLDCSGNSFSSSSSVRAILDYWGALQDTSMIRPNGIPSLIMHGLNDGVVPYNQGNPFGVPTLPQTMGGGPIYNRLQNLGIYSELYTSNSNLHMLDGSDNGTFPASGPNAYWKDTILPKSTQFLVKNMKPNPTQISPEIQFSCLPDRVRFELEREDNQQHVQWIYPEQNTLTVDRISPNILDLTFNSEGTYSIQAIVFNEVACASDTLYYTSIVERAAEFNVTATYTGQNQYTISTHPATEVNWEVNQQNYGNSTELILSTDTIVDLTISWTWSHASNRCTITDNLFIQHNSLTAYSVESPVIKAFPNPFFNTLKLECTTPSDFVIYDVHGKIVKKGFVEQFVSIATEEWPVGLYILTIMNEQGATMQRIEKR